MKYSGLVAGLGNPGTRYAGTRHNCGFMFIDKLLELAKINGDVEELNGKKFNALLFKISLPSLRGAWLAAKPLTFMNDSGKSIQPMLNWHNLTAKDLVVAQDELDIPPGELRFKFGGGLAGHNGLISIVNYLGIKDFYRIRIGIGKPMLKSDMLNWVLGKPAPEDREKISHIIDLAVETFFIFSNDGLQRAMEFAHRASA